MVTLTVPREQRKHGDTEAPKQEGHEEHEDTKTQSLAVFLRGFVSFVASYLYRISRLTTSAQVIRAA